MTSEQRSRSLILVPIDFSYTTSYRLSIVTFALLTLPLLHLSVCSHFSPSYHFSVSTKLSNSSSSHNTSFSLSTPFNRHQLLSWRSWIFFTYNRPSWISWLSWLLTIPLFYLCLTNMLLLSLNCLNANPNLILGSLRLSAPSDQLSVVLKTSGNALTLL